MGDTELRRGRRDLRLVRPLAQERRQGLPATTTPHVRYFLMGANKLEKRRDSGRPAAPGRCGCTSAATATRTASTAAASCVRGRAGRRGGATAIRYDPMNPVPTVGGGDCCNGGIVIPGAFDQRGVEIRDDVLVYSSEPLDEPIEVSGFVDAVLQVSSSAPDTDFAVKLVDVAPDGTAWIIGDTILRARLPPRASTSQR